MNQLACLAGGKKAAAAQRVCTYKEERGMPVVTYRHTIHSVISSPSLPPSLQHPHHYPPSISPSLPPLLPGATTPASGCGRKDRSRHLPPRLSLFLVLLCGSD